VAESEGVIRRLLASPLAVESVLATPARGEKLAPLLPADVPLYTAPRAVLGEVVGYDLHRGCAAVGRRPVPSRLPTGADAPATVVVAERLADPANVGALVRNCRAFGVDLLLLDARGADPFTPRAIRASAGWVFEQPLAIRPDIARCLDRLRTGHTVLAATARPEATPLADCPACPAWILLLGNEGDGLSDDLLAFADRRVCIPLVNEVSSLNVAAASAVLLHTLRKALGPSNRHKS
jgi:tRNA G18 (ribose-2'-O)-methylase SpoU